MFLSAPDAVLHGLRERGWLFYTFIGGSARFMFAWDSDIAVVRALGQDIVELCAPAAGMPPAPQSNYG